MAEPPSQAQALELQRKILTLDTHLDTPANFGNPDWSILDDHSASGRQSQVDYPRMVSGALDGGFWAIYTGQGPQTVEADLKARDHGLKRLIEIREMLAAHPDTFALALTADDAARIKIEGKRVVYISMENASPLVHDPSLLQFYYAQGLRLMSLVHFANNQLADSGTDPKGAQWNGLSPAGQALVAEANRLGIVLDQSHGSDAEFDALLALSKTPIILSHSGARAVYDHPRNIDDERLKRLAETGGVIQVNSYGGYLIDIPKDEARLQAEAELQQRFGDDPESLPAAQQDEYRAAWKAMNEAHPLKRASIDDFFRHLDHVLEVAGPEHVGIGMDWDGGGGVIGLDSVADLPKITSHLMEKGYSEAQIADIWGGNVLRVLRRAEAYAASGKTD
ncbi:dipeptidase [Pseudoxanthomonas kalamensis]|uniref:dipeptidase n=1 Tax=Pseudoxanthomonas kalamensis TaxID=289483 RepID=UPI001FE8EFC6|nr:dipeptidase [Pseudoxanthomonas kalamensis]